MSIKLPENFAPQGPWPLDSREQVTTKAELTSGLESAYYGQLITCREDKKIYMQTAYPEDEGELVDEYTQVWEPYEPGPVNILFEANAFNNSSELWEFILNKCQHKTSEQMFGTNGYKEYEGEFPSIDEDTVYYCTKKSTDKGEWSALLTFFSKIQQAVDAGRSFRINIHGGNKSSSDVNKQINARTFITPINIKKGKVAYSSYNASSEYSTIYVTLKDGYAITFIEESMIVYLAFPKSLSQTATIIMGINNIWF